MTQKDKELLLKDLCARLPYGVKLDTPDGIDTLGNVDTNEGWINASYDVDEVKPYLRPLSSMTDSEKQEQYYYKHDIMYQGIDAIEIYMNQYVDWLDSNHFDWRMDGNNKTLIENGLAIEVTKKNNPYG